MALIEPPKSCNKSTCTFRRCWVLNIPQKGWRIGTSEEIDWLIKHSDIVTYIKTQRIRSIGHIVKMGKERTMTAVTEWRTFTVRGTGRQRLRWACDVTEDLGKMKIQISSKMAMDREA